MRTTPIMTGCEFGDIVLVPFPFIDQSTTKKRPAVVVSSAAYNRERPDYIIMAVTSRTKPSPTLDDWQKAGLLRLSMIKPVMATIERGLVLWRLGSLDLQDQAALKGVLSDILG